jgi:hypothetical protein
MMEVKIIKSYDENDSRSEEMYINEKFAESAYPMCECPEDATLERDLISCSRIAKLMELAYIAGKNGEDFIVKFENSEEE